MKKKGIRAAIFYRFIPHYRLGVFRELQREEDLSVTICSPDDYSSRDRFLQTVHQDKAFPFINIRTWFWRIPFSQRHLVLQPYAVWSMLTRRFHVHIMGNTFLEINVWICLLLSRLLGQRVCLWGHGFSLPETENGNRLRGIIMRMAHAIVFYTEGDRNRWIERGMPPEKLFVAYNAVDTDAVTEMKKQVTAESLAAFRQEWKLEGKKVVVYIGRLLAYKKPDVAIRAMASVVEQIPQAHLVMIGDGPMREELDQLITELELSDHVTLTGTLPGEENVAKLHMCSKVGVMPACAGLGIQHAFGYGLPMIVGDNLADHPPEIELVVEGVTGMYCRDGDPEHFAQAICRLLTNDEERKRLGTNALGVIEEKYNMQRMARGLLDAIRYCKNRSRRPR